MSDWLAAPDSSPRASHCIPSALPDLPGRRKLCKVRKEKAGATLNLFPGPVLYYSCAALAHSRSLGSGIDFPRLNLPHGVSERSCSTHRLLLPGSALRMTLRQDCNPRLGQQLVPPSLVPIPLPLTASGFLSQVAMAGSRLETVGSVFSRCVLRVGRGQGSQQVTTLLA